MRIDRPGLVPASAPRRLGRGAWALALALSTGSLAACDSVSMKDLGGEPSKAEDDAARKAHFEEAAQTYYEAGKYEQSAVQWRRVLELAPDDQKAKWGLAKSLANQGTPPLLRQAEQIYEQIVDLDWSHPTLGDRRFEVEKDFAQVYLDLADWYDRDLHVLEQKLDASKTEAETAQIRADIARESAMRNDLLAKAMPRFEHVLALSPENPFALAGLAKAHLLVGDSNRGIEYARRYVALSENSQKGWENEMNDYAATLAKDHEKLTDEQREFYRKKIRGAREKEIGMRLLIASVLVRTGATDAAVAEYDRVLQLDGARAAGYLERAQAKAMGGRYREAVLDLERYLQVTDPVRQRHARVGAAELLQKYRIAAAKSASPRDGFAPVSPAPDAPTSPTPPGPTGTVVPPPAGR